MCNPFQPTAGNLTWRVAPGVAAASVSLPAGTTQVVLWNSNASAAPVVVYVQFTTAATVPAVGGAQGSQSIAPGAYLTLSCNPGVTGNLTTLSYITEAGTAELHITPGKWA